jgi:hypothetical protein
MNNSEYESTSKSAWCNTLFRMVPFLPRVITVSTSLSQIFVTVNFVDLNFVSVSHFLCVCCKSDLPYPRFSHRNDIYASVITSYVWKRLHTAKAPGHSTHAEVSLTGDGLVFFVPLMSHNLPLPARLHRDSPVGWFCFHSYTFIAGLTAIVCGSSVRSRWIPLELSFACFWSQLIIYPCRLHSMEQKWSAWIFLRYEPEMT